MAEFIAYSIALMVVLKFAWDHLIFPVTDNVLGIIMHIKQTKRQQAVPEREPAVGFIDFDEYDDEEEEFYDQ